MKRIASLVLLVLALTGSMAAGAGAASATPGPSDLTSLIMGPGHCC